MKNLILLVLIMFCASNLKAQEENILNPAKPKNCFIKITSTYKTDEVHHNTRKFFYKTKNQCLKMKKILSDNFSPREIVKVETEMEWTGK